MLYNDKIKSIRETIFFTDIQYSYSDIVAPFYVLLSLVAICSIHLSVAGGYTTYCWKDSIFKEENCFQVIVYP